MTWIISVLCLLVGYYAGARHALRQDRSKVIEPDEPQVNTIEYAYTSENGETYYYIRPRRDQ